MDCSPPGSSIHGIFQARALEWAAISFSRGSSWPRDQTLVSHIVDRCFTIWATREVCILCDPMDHSLPDFSDHGNFQVRILEWVVTSYFRVSSQPWNRTYISCVSCIGRQILYHCTIFIISFFKSVSIRRGLLPCLAFQDSSHGLLTWSGFSASLFYLYISYLASLEETVIYCGLCMWGHHCVTVSEFNIFGARDFSTDAYRLFSRHVLIFMHLIGVCRCGSWCLVLTCLVVVEAQGTPGARDGSGGGSHHLWSPGGQTLCLFLVFGQMEAAVHSFSRREVAADHDPLISFFLYCVPLQWFPLLCLPAHWSILILHLFFHWFLLCIFFISFILFFNSVWLLIFSFC